ncbi:MAG: hypothetical protein FK734_10680 [Asgard group archaeon]|nr:hypothetical protein [Asgard group archaeon]
MSVQASQSRDELYYTDNSGSIVQLTYSGSLGGQNLSPASGSEVKTGNTFDGYPVYRRFFSASNISNNTVIQTGVRDLVRYGGWAVLGSTDYTRCMLPYHYGTTAFFYFRITDDNALTILKHTAFSKDCRFFIEYTKI